jgi:hypothetical protein
MNGDFSGNKWEVGYGVRGCSWVRAIESVRRELGRYLTAPERVQFARGWMMGLSDVKKWEEDMRDRQDYEGVVTPPVIGTYQST